jgi:hypothetical protein
MNKRKQLMQKKIYMYTYINERTSHEKTLRTLLVLSDKLHVHFKYHFSCFILWLLSKRKVFIQFVLHCVKYN